MYLHARNLALSKPPTPPRRCRHLAAVLVTIVTGDKQKKRDALAKKEVGDLREAMEHVSDSAKGLARQRDDARAALARAKRTLRRMVPVRCRFFRGMEVDGVDVAVFERVVSLPPGRFRKLAGGGGGLEIVEILVTNHENSSRFPSVGGVVLARPLSDFLSSAAGKRRTTKALISFEGHLMCCPLRFLEDNIGRCCEFYSRFPRRDSLGGMHSQRMLRLRVPTTLDAS